MARMPKHKTPRRTSAEAGRLTENCSLKYCQNPPYPLDTFRRKPTKPINPAPKSKAEAGMANSKSLFFSHRNTPTKTDICPQGLFSPFVFSPSTLGNLAHFRPLGALHVRLCVSVANLRTMLQQTQVTIGLLDRQDP